MSKRKKRSQNKIKIQREYVKKHCQLSNFEGETNGRIAVKRDSMESVKVLD